MGCAEQIAAESSTGADVFGDTTPSDAPSVLRFSIHLRNPKTGPFHDPACPHDLFDVSRNDSESFVRAEGGLIGSFDASRRRHM